MPSAKWLGLATVGAVIAVIAIKKAQAKPPPPPSPCSSVRQVVVSSTYSSSPVSRPIYPEPYFEVTEVVRNISTIDGSICEEFTVTLPITPGMVSRDPSAYPDYIVNYYKQEYPELFKVMLV
jgi:hypothetical protein